MELDDGILEGRPPRLAETARAVARAVAGDRRGLTAAVKWGQFTYAVDGDFHHWICAIGVTKKTVTLTFHFGGLLDDPDSELIAGTSRFLRKLEYREASEVDRAVIDRFVDRAVSSYPYFVEHWEELRSGERP